MNTILPHTFRQGYLFKRDGTISPFSMLKAPQVKTKLTSKAQETNN